MTIHEIETQMWRWRRRADGLFDVLIDSIIKHPELLTDESLVEMLEYFSNDRYDDPDEWQRILNQRMKQGASV